MSRRRQITHIIHIYQAQIVIINYTNCPWYFCPFRDIVSASQHELSCNDKLNNFYFGGRHCPSGKVIFNANPCLVYDKELNVSYSDQIISERKCIFRTCYFKHNLELTLHLGTNTIKFHFPSGRKEPEYSFS